MVPKPLFLVGWPEVSLLKVLEWDCKGSWWRNLWKAMTSLAGGSLDTTIGQRAISQGEDLDVEQHRTDRLELLQTPLCQPLAVFNHGSHEWCSLPYFCFPDIMQISPCGHLNLEVHWKGNLGNVVLAWPSWQRRAPPLIYYIHALPNIKPTKYPHYKYEEELGTLNMRSIQ